MKHITKNQEPPAFIQWKSGKATTKWNKLGGASLLKRVLHTSILREQGGICCYCETILINRKSHIEHFVPRSADASLTFDYNNLLCSCQVNLTKDSPRTCGIAKGSSFHKNLVSPLEQDCEQHFTFTYDGEIQGNDTRGQKTVTRLNLNEPALVEKRKSLIDTFTDMLGDEDFTEEDFAKYVHDYLLKSSDGNFNAFWTTVKYLFAPHTI